MNRRENPAEMSFATLVNYYYDSACLGQPNWVFPMQLARAVRQDKKKPEKSHMDSRPRVPMEIER